MDGFFHVKNIVEAEKYFKPVKDRKVEASLGLSGAKRLILAEKRVKSLQKKLNARDKANANLMKKLMETEVKLNKLMEERDRD